MKFYRIYAILLRHLYSLRHNLDRMTDVFYWPIIDLFMWGLTSLYFSSHYSGASHVLFAIVSGLLFWTLTWRLQYEVAVGLLDDVWARNMINLFVSPLTFWEWISALSIVSLIKTSLSFLTASILALVLYNVGVLKYGWYILPFTLCLLLTGWTFGFFITGLILRFGQRVQSFGWTLGAIIIPFSAIYYPVSILPSWVQKICLFVPTSYIFEGIREFLTTGQISSEKLYISFGLNILYFFGAFVFLVLSFRNLLKRGIAKFT